MTMEEFEKSLREKLKLLEENEINDIIEEYKGYIEEKMQNGATEKEAIEDFGDMDELARELLKAYKINVEHTSTEKNILNTIVDGFVTGIDSIVKVFSNKNSKEIIQIILELFVILIGIAVCHIPFHLLEDIGYNMFNIFGNDFGIGLFKIWKFTLELIYLITAVVLFAKIFEKRYINTIKTIAIKDEKINMPKEVIKKEEPQKIEPQPKKGILDLLSTMCLWFLKFIAFWILLGISFYILGIGMVLGIGIYFLVQGVAYYGIYISILMLLFLGILGFIVFFNFIASRKNNIKFLIISFLSCMVILGISFSAATMELTTTKFINAIPDNYERKIEVETLTMNDDDIITGPIHFEVDETLENEIKIEFQYFPEFYQINPIIERTNNQLDISYHSHSVSWNTKVIEDIIDNLKERKLYKYDFSPQITVYTSSKNIAKLKENKKIWLSKQRYSEKLYEDCQMKLEFNGYSELSEKCKEILMEY